MLRSTSSGCKVSAHPSHSCGGQAFHIPFPLTGLYITRSIPGIAVLLDVCSKISMFPKVHFKKLIIYSMDFT